MEFSYIIGLIGGLILFLYGMTFMSEGLELAAGTKMQSIIEKVTSNKLKGILVGVVVTGIIQSSSATTVMLVGFVNAGIMTLGQSIGVIMGANIGTTVTGQLVALDIGQIAPLIALAGFVMATFIKKKKKFIYIGQVFLGLGFLFMGMKMMGDSMSPLRDSKVFVDMITLFKNPFLGILAGTIITAIIQSSSASLGILQAVANNGLIPLGMSMYIICGFNIGTCITSVLSSIGTSKNAQRTAAIHVLFNVIGTVIFVILSFKLPIAEFVERFSRNTPAAQIANMHTLFNVFSTIILLPFTKQLAKLATILVKGTDKKAEDRSLLYINPNSNKDISLAFLDIRAEAKRMFKKVEENFSLAMEMFLNYDEDVYDKIFENEETINYLNSAISRYIIGNMSGPKSEDLTEELTSYLNIVRGLERMGDHIKNLAEYGKYIYDKELEFTRDAIKEIEYVKDDLLEMFNSFDDKVNRDDRNENLNYFYYDIEKYLVRIRRVHTERMKAGICDPESGIVYDKYLIAFERIMSYLRKAGHL